MRLPYWMVGGSASALLVVSLSPLPPAYASTACSSSQATGHCYAEMEDDNTPSTVRWGGYIRMDSDDLCFDDDDYAFGNEEMWGFTSGSKTGGGYWVEVGNQAYRNFASDVYRVTIFWADNKPSAGYTQHNISSPLPVMDAEMGVHVEHSGTTDWDVYARGTQIGTNTNNGSISYGAQGGLEVRYRNSRIHGHFDQSQHQESGEGLQSGWYDPFEWDTGGDAAVSWLSTADDGVHTSYNYSGTTCPSGGAAAARRPTSSSGDADDGQTDPLEVALALAATSGDADPSVTNVEQMTRNQALQIMGGDVVPDDGPVTLIQMTGSFQGSAASIPEGAATPTGNQLSVSVDSAGNITDWNLQSD